MHDITFESESYDIDFDPIFFLRAHLKWDVNPHKWQIRELYNIYYHLKKNHDKSDVLLRLAYAGAFNIGKSTFTCWALLYVMEYARLILPNIQFSCSVFSGTMEQLKSVTFKEFHRWIEKGRAKEYFNISANTVTSAKQPNKYKIWGKAWSNVGDSKQGQHAKEGLNIVFWDEGTTMPDEAETKINSYFGDDLGIFVVLGNPLTTKTIFHTFFTNLHTNFWKFCHITKFEALKEGQETDRFIEETKTKYGENSNQYKEWVLGQFPTEEPTSFFKGSIIYRAKTRNNRILPHNRLYMGVDVCKGDSTDFHAVVIRNARYIIKIVREKIEYGAFTDLLIQLIMNWKPVFVGIDDNSWGYGIFTKLKQVFGNGAYQGIRIIPCSGNGEDFNSLQYFNARSERYGRIAEWLELEGCLDMEIENMDILIKELEGIEIEDTEDRRIKVKSKKVMQVKKSADLVDAFGYSLADKVMHQQDICEIQYPVFDPSIHTRRERLGSYF